jgi:hypothetical protein
MLPVILILWCLDIIFLPENPLCVNRMSLQARKARGIHRLIKVSPWPAMPDLSMPCGRATHETVLQPFQEWLARRADSLQAVFYPLGYPMLYGPDVT